MTCSFCEREMGWRIWDGKLSWEIGMSMKVQLSEQMDLPHRLSEPSQHWFWRQHGCVVHKSSTTQQCHSLEASTSAQGVQWISSSECRHCARSMRPIRMMMSSNKPHPQTTSRCCMLLYLRKWRMWSRLETCIQTLPRHLFTYVTSSFVVNRHTTEVQRNALGKEQGNCCCYSCGDQAS